MPPVGAEIQKSQHKNWFYQNHISHPKFIQLTSDTDTGWRTGPAHTAWE